jgi:hypothetical protein
MRRSAEHLVTFVVASVLAAITALFIVVSGGFTMTSAGPGTVANRADAPEPPPCSEPGSRATGTCATRSAVLTFAGQRSELHLGELRARVRSVEALRASTPSGIRRNRMRLVVALEADAGTQDAAFDAAGDASPIYLSLPGERIEPDPRAQRFDVTTPLRAGEIRRGVLHFELGGDQTTRMLRSGGELAMRPAGTGTGRPRIGIIRLAPPRARELY